MIAAKHTVYFVLCTLYFVLKTAEIDFVFQDSVDVIPVESKKVYEREVAVWHCSRKNIIRLMPFVFRKRISVLKTA